MIRFVPISRRYLAQRGQIYSDYEMCIRMVHRDTRLFRLNKIVTLHALVGWVDFLDLELVTRNVNCAFLQELLSCVLLVEGDKNST